MKTIETTLKTNYNIVIENCLLLWGKNLFTPVKDDKKPSYYQVSVAIHDKNPGMDKIRNVHKAFTNKYGAQMSKYSVYKAFSRDKQNRLRQYFDIVEAKGPADMWGQDLLKKYNLTTRIDDYNSLSLYSNTQDFFVTSIENGQVVRHTTAPNPDPFNTGCLVNISFYLYYYEAKEFMIGDATKSRLAIKPRCELESIHFIDNGLSIYYTELPSTGPSQGMVFDKQSRFVTAPATPQAEAEEFEIVLTD